MQIYANSIAIEYIFMLQIILSFRGDMTYIIALCMVLYDIHMRFVLKECVCHAPIVPFLYVRGMLFTWWRKDLTRAISPASVTG